MRKARTGGHWYCNGCPLILCVCVTIHIMLKFLKRKYWWRRRKRNSNVQREQGFKFFSLFCLVFFTENFLFCKTTWIPRTSGLISTHAFPSKTWWVSNENNCTPIVITMVTRQIIFIVTKLVLLGWFTPSENKCKSELELDVISILKWNKFEYLLNRHTNIILKRFRTEFDFAFAFVRCNCTIRPLCIWGNTLLLIVTFLLNWPWQHEVKCVKVKGIFCDKCLQRISWLLSRIKLLIREAVSTNSFLPLIPMIFRSSRI